MLDVERYLAFDLGAESGRAMLGTLASGRLHLEEIHRFANDPVQVGHSLYWDPLHLWAEVKRGLVCAAARAGRNLAGVGVDTWGIDFGLLDRCGDLIGLPHHYRDSRTEGILEDLNRCISPFDLYSQVGSFSLAISTLCQLLAMRRQGSPILDIAGRLLMMPDIFHYWLCGRQATEATIAGTTQFYNLATGDWHRELLERLGLPANLPGEIVPTATVLGRLLQPLAEEVGLDAVPVIAPACHDTPCAISITPSREASFTAISSGTWSIIGAELAQPLLTQDAMDHRFLNEVGACGKTLLGMNSMGLWPLQECRRQWVREGHDWSYGDLTEMAAEAPPFCAVVDPDRGDFLRPGDMTAKVADYCRRTGQNAPADAACTTRILLEGLALRYRKAIADLDELIGRSTPLIHILGGGSRNRLLCQFAADATGRPVLAGPSEATATGNVLLQALGRGSLGSMAEVREVVAHSFALTLYEPHPSAAWDEAYAAFLGRPPAGD
jgi:rhamnulokinase